MGCRPQPWAPRGPRRPVLTSLIPEELLQLDALLLQLAEGHFDLLQPPLDGLRGEGGNQMRSRASWYMGWGWDGVRDGDGDLAQPTRVTCALQNRFICASRTRRGSVRLQVAYFRSPRIGHCKGTQGVRQGRPQNLGIRPVRAQWGHCRLGTALTDSPMVPRSRPSSSSASSSSSSSSLSLSSESAPPQK